MTSKAERMADMIDEDLRDGTCPKASVPTEFTGYARPTTRGELLEKLKAGTACEVATSVAAMTGIMLSGWLGFDKYTIRPSENKGWSVFEA